MRITTWHVLPCLKEKHFFNVNSSSVTRSVYADEHHIVMAQFGFQTRYLLLKIKRKYKWISCFMCQISNNAGGSIDSSHLKIAVTFPCPQCSCITIKCLKASVATQGRDRQNTDVQRQAERWWKRLSVHFKFRCKGGGEAVLRVCTVCWSLSSWSGAWGTGWSTRGARPRRLGGGRECRCEAQRSWGVSCTRCRHRRSPRL